MSEKHRIAEKARLPRRFSFVIVVHIDSGPFQIILVGDIPGVDASAGVRETIRSNADQQTRSFPPRLAHFCVLCDNVDFAVVCASADNAAIRNAVFSFRRSY